MGHSLGHWAWDLPNRQCHEKQTRRILKGRWGTILEKETEETWQVKAVWDLG